MSFSNLGLNEEILKAIEDKGYKTPSPIQEKAIPVILEGVDVLAGAQTGTGKTAAFTLPLIQNLGGEHKKLPRALILTPTRELAAQIAENVEEYAKYTDLTSVVIFGGVGLKHQIDKLATGVDIIIATPGRFMDLCKQGHVTLTRIETLILDEADRMLDMGFVHDIKKIVARLPRQRQNLMFSATYSREIRSLSDTFLKNPISIEVAKENATAEKVAQEAYGVSKMGKSDFVTKLIKKEDWFQVLIFTRTKHGANNLADYLSKEGIPSAAIHGNKSQNARTRALAAFKAGKTQALVATDIAARGIDIDQLPVVINYELPNVAEDYVHRIGRTGRAGCDGLAISLVCPEEKSFFAGIERITKQKIAIEVQAGYNDRPDKNADRPRHKEERSDRRNGAGSSRSVRNGEGQAQSRSRGPQRPAQPRAKGYKGKSSDSRGGNGGAQRSSDGRGGNGGGGQRSARPSQPRRAKSKRA